jgi:hypothetical protein
MWTLVEVLGEALSLEAQTAWRKVYRILSGVMQEGSSALMPGCAA